MNEKESSVSNPMGENGKVTYSVKELLADIRTDVKEIIQKIDTKADKSDLILQGNQIQNQITRIHERISVLELDESGDKAVESFKKWFLPLAIGVIVSILLGVGGIAVQFITSK